MGLHHVEPGGEPLVLPLDDQLTVTKVSVGGMDNNAYVLQAGGATLLIDAAAEPDRLLGVLGDRTPDTIVTTHRHDDHWQALAGVAATTSARLLAGGPDVDAIEAGAGVSDVGAVWDGETIPVGDQKLEVIGLVGHTPGSITLVYAGTPTHLFTGDSLFPGGPGKTWSAADFVSLVDDLEAKIFARFGDDTVVHPGHGDATTLGAERPQLAEWRSRGW